MSNEELIAMLAARVAERIERKLVEISNSRSTIHARLLNIRQAAEYLGRSEGAVQHMVFKRVLPVVRVGRRVHLDRRDLDAWIDRNRMH